MHTSSDARMVQYVADYLTSCMLRKVFVGSTMFACLCSDSAFV